MPEDREKIIILGGSFETKDVPSVYCNQANVSMSYNDVRVYISEIAPSEIVIGPQQAPGLIPREPNLSPRMCLVLSPEFARSLAKAIMIGTEKYEATFGPLRPEPVVTQGEKK